MTGEFVACIGPLKQGSTHLPMKLDVSTVRSEYEHEDVESLKVELARSDDELNF